MGLQFSWIEANLLGFFLGDVRNSMGKFDEIKEKFVINPAPITLQSSLNVGGSRWTRNLSRNSIDFFTNRSKVKEQGREIHAFKEENWPEDHGRLMRSWGRNWCAVEAVSIERHCGFKSPVNQLEFCLKKTHDQGAIVARSRHDRGPIVRSILKKTPSDDRGIDSTTKDSRSRLDRAAIAVWSDRDRGVLPRIFYTVRLNL